MSEDSKYFNFPIMLLSGFLPYTHERLDSILCYCIYTKMQKDGISMTEAANFFNVKMGSEKKVTEKGKRIAECVPERSPKVGMELTQFWDFYNGGHKSEFEKVCFLGFLALKSILQAKSYCIVSNGYWLARMDGKSKAVKSDAELSPELRPYAKRYWTDKIKTELKLNWHLVTYGHYTRGFAISFKMPLEEMIYQVEVRRRSFQAKQMRDEERAARIRIMEEIKAMKNNGQNPELKQHHNSTYKKGKTN